MANLDINFVGSKKKLHNQMLKEFKTLGRKALTMNHYDFAEVTNINDPKNMGSDFVEFSTPELKPYISINKTRLEDILKVYKKYSQDNILELDNKDIDTFNKIAEEQEIVPREYKLLLLVSEFDKLENILIHQ